MRHRRLRFDPWIERILWRRKRQPTPVCFGEGNGTPLQYSCLEKSHGQRSQVGCSPWGHKESDLTSLSLFTFMYWRRKWQPTPVFLPGESQRRWSLVGCRLWGRTWLKRLSSTSSQYASLDNSMDRGAWQATYSSWGCQELIWLSNWAHYIYIYVYII